MEAVAASVVVEAAVRDVLEEEVPAMIFYAPTDVDAAYDAWGANCGPCALAAILGREVEAVRPFLNGFDKRRYMNPTHMKQSLAAAGCHVTTIGMTTPTHGLAFIQWHGPWTEPGKPIAAAYRHTHWIACAEGQIYDVNADALWVPALTWVKAMPVLIREEVKGASGEWYVRSGLEVQVEKGEVLL